MEFLLVGLFAIADRFAGGGMGWQSTFKGRPVWYATLALGALLGLVFGWKAALLAFAWFIWREPKWALFGGSLAPTRQQVPGTFLRHLLALSAVIPAIFIGNVMVAAVGMLGFAFVATVLAYWLKQESLKGKDVNATVELVRGAVYGLIVVLIL